MQRLLNNLLTVVVIGLVSTGASLALAHGGGHHSGHGRSTGHSHSRGHHGSSHSHGSHRGAHHTSVSHSHSRSFRHYGFHYHTGSRSVADSGVHLNPDPPIWVPGNPVHLNPNPPIWVPGNPVGLNPNPPIYVPGHHPRWHLHLCYPVGFWFGGNYDVADTAVVDGGIDVEFTKICQLDAGDPANNLAPAYRIWFHNNSTVDINQPFDVALLASSDDKLSEGLPFSSVRINGMTAGETTSVDIRLPISAMSMATADGQSASYAYVHTIIDSQKELVETNKANNLSVDSRDDISAVSE